MHQLALTSEDNAALGRALTGLAESYDNIEDPGLIRQARVLACTLPTRLLEFLDEFRAAEPSALAMVSGLDINAARLPPTPEHWRDSQHGSPTFPQEIFFLLCASALGDVFGWATQQDGRFMHDVLPIKGHEHYEIGSNSLQHLSWHTEDAFHPCRGDYVALMCLKNPGGVATTACTTADIHWENVDVEALFEAEFTIMPDNSHQPQNGTASSGDPDIDALRERSFAIIQSWNERPERRPLLFGDPRDPYLALDPYHMDPAEWPVRCQKAFKQLCTEIETNLKVVSLQPGDCLFIDNFRTVHGRSSFQARYDGTDRWLKRLNVTRNIRGSRAWRPAPDSRVIY